MSVLNWLGKAITNSTKWLAKAFVNVEKDAPKLAVVITEEVKPFLTGTVGLAIASVVDSVLKTHVAEEVRVFAVKEINIVLAAELALVGLPDNATPEQIEAFGETVVTAFTGLEIKGKAKLFSTVTAQVIGIIEQYANNNTKLTFAELVILGQTAWKDYQSDLNIANTETTVIAPEISLAPIEPSIPDVEATEPVVPVEQPELVPN